ncbi:uncharacterized protein RB166_005536 [Leptodactylus fuscus]|uniref:uncharacterized protein LOC142196866 n=1 Tax=Leptodactylus fuscus TaxID=238119 RepID=UPI003F4E64EC
MEDMNCTRAESGFLTGGHNSCLSTPRESCFVSEEQLKEPFLGPWQTPRTWLQSVSLSDLDEVQLSCNSQINYSSAPNISNCSRIELNRFKVNGVEEEREALQEPELNTDNSGETGDNEKKEEQKKKRSFCWTLVPLWLLVCSFFLFAIILIGVLLGFMLPRGSVKEFSPAGPPCEDSWIWVRGRCYYFSDDRNTWNESLEFCTTHGSTLAILLDQETEETIKRYRENVNYWIGLSMNNEDRWMWVNGSPYDGSIENPNIHLLRCAYLNSHLGALACSTRRQWICVKDST